MADTEITRTELREKLRVSIEISNFEYKPTGGQHVGRVNSKVRLTCKDLDISIEVGYYRSIHRNKELALNLFELTLLEVT